MNWLGPETLPAFLLVLTRITGMLPTAPVFGGPAVPAVIRIGTAGVLALLIAPPVSPAVPVRPDFVTMTLAAAAELSIGLLIGFAASLLFAAVQSAGHLVDLDMGVALANVLDPVTHEQVSVVAQFQLYLAAAAWLLVGGHQCGQSVGAHPLRHGRGGDAELVGELSLGRSGEQSPEHHERPV